MSSSQDISQEKEVHYKDGKGNTTGFDGTPLNRNWVNSNN